MCGAGGQGDIRTFPSFPVSLKLLKIKVTRKKTTAFYHSPNRAPKRFLMALDRGLYGLPSREIWPAIRHMGQEVLVWWAHLA